MRLNITFSWGSGAPKSPASGTSALILSDPELSGSSTGRGNPLDRPTANVYRSPGFFSRLQENFNAWIINKDAQEIIYYDCGTDGMAIRERHDYIIKIFNYMKDQCIHFQGDETQSSHSSEDEYIRAADAIWNSIRNVLKQKGLEVAYNTAEYLYFRDREYINDLGYSGYKGFINTKIDADSNLQTELAERIKILRGEIKSTIVGLIESGNINCKEELENKINSILRAKITKDKVIHDLLTKTHQAGKNLTETAHTLYERWIKYISKDERIGNDPQQFVNDCKDKNNWLYRYFMTRVIDKIRSGEIDSNGKLADNGDFISTIKDDLENFFRKMFGEAKPVPQNITSSTEEPEGMAGAAASGASPETAPASIKSPADIVEVVKSTQPKWQENVSIRKLREYDRMMLKYTGQRSEFAAFLDANRKFSRDDLKHATGISDEHEINELWNDLITGGYIADIDMTNSSGSVQGAFCDSLADYKYGYIGLRVQPKFERYQKQITDALLQTNDYITVHTVFYMPEEDPFWGDGGYIGGPIFLVEHNGILWDRTGSHNENMKAFIDEHKGTYIYHDYDGIHTGGSASTTWDNAREVVEPLVAAVTTVTGGLAIIYSGGTATPAVIPWLLRTTGAYYGINSALTLASQIKEGSFDLNKLDTIANIGMVVASAIPLANTLASEAKCAHLAGVRLALEFANAAGKAGNFTAIGCFTAEQLQVIYEISTNKEIPEQGKENAILMAISQFAGNMGLMILAHKAESRATDPVKTEALTEERLGKLSPEDTAKIAADTEQICPGTASKVREAMNAGLTRAWEAVKGKYGESVEGIDQFTRKMGVSAMKYLAEMKDKSNQLMDAIAEFLGLRGNQQWRLQYQGAGGTVSKIAQPAEPAARPEVSEMRDKRGKGNGGKVGGKSANDTPGMSTTVTIAELNESNVITALKSFVAGKGGKITSIVKDSYGIKYLIEIKGKEYSIVLPESSRSYDGINTFNEKTGTRASVTRGKGKTGFYLSFNLSETVKLSGYCAEKTESAFIACLREAAERIGGSVPEPVFHEGHKEVTIEAKGRTTKIDVPTGSHGKEVYRGAQSFDDWLDRGRADIKITPGKNNKGFNVVLTF